jgi:hypothetical protein
MELNETRNTNKPDALSSCPNERRTAMKKLLIATTVAAAALLTTLPASAQFYAGADPGGVGVQVGPLGVGVGPRYGWHDGYYTDGYGAYGAGECRVIRERIVTPSGRAIHQTRRICD